MKVFVILLVLIGFAGTAWAEIALSAEPASAKFGDDIIIHASVSSYDDALRYYIDVINPSGQQIDSTLWFVKEDFNYTMRTVHPAYQILRGGEFTIQAEQAINNIERTGNIVQTTLFFLSNPPPLYQLKGGIVPENVICNDELVLIQKYDGTPACVTESTKQKLIERGWTKDDSTLSKINTSCMTLEQSKETAPFFKTPSYLPEGYSYVCSRSGMPFESYIVYYNQEFPTDWQILELVSDGAIFIYQIDERNLVGEKKFQTYGSPEQRTRETYDSVIEGNPSLNPQLITINGMLAYAVDFCPDCGMQTANFTDGTSIQESTSTETKIKFIDENGVSYMLKTTLPLQELIKVAESLQ